jgi:hypothetical protein
MSATLFKQKAAAGDPDSSLNGKYVRADDDCATTQLAGVPDSSLNGKYIKFILRAGSYGIDELKVLEIIRYPAITQVPQIAASAKPSAKCQIKCPECQPFHCRPAE